jgi:hypothetical protein
MKNILKISLMFAVFFTAIQMHAGDVDFSLKVKRAAGKTISFSLNEVKNVTISIYDVNDILVNKENIAANGNVLRTYNLDALPNGTYFLEAETAFKISRYKIVVNKNTAILAKEVVSEFYKPVLVNKNGMVTLSILNLNELPVNVKVLNSEGGDVYEENIPADITIAKIYDFTKSKMDTYTFVITYNNKTFVETVTSK